MKIQVIVEKEKERDDLCVGWGGVYFIDNDILFDTGEKWDYLKTNADILGLELSDIDTIVISHKHWDHVGGLPELLDIAGKKIYVVDGVSVNDDFTGEIVKTDKITKIKDGVYVTGARWSKYKDTDIAEQSIIIETEKGISVIFGCAHNGVLKVVKEVKDYFKGKKLYAVFGGFHFINEDARVVKYVAEELLSLGVKYVMPCHCTGYDACKIFQESFNDKCLSVFAGSEFEL